MWQLYKWNTKVMETGWGYWAWTWINITSAWVIQNTWITSINGDNWAITWVVRILPGSPVSIVYKRIWTQAQYEALSEYREDTEYNILAD